MQHDHYSPGEWDAALACLAQINRLDLAHGPVAAADAAWRDMIDRREAEERRWLSRLGCHAWMEERN